MFEICGAQLRSGGRPARRECEVGLGGSRLSARGSTCREREKFGGRGRGGDRRTSLPRRLDASMPRLDANGNRAVAEKRSGIEKSSGPALANLVDIRSYHERNCDA